MIRESKSAYPELAARQDYIRARYSYGRRAFCRNDHSRLGYPRSDDSAARDEGRTQLSGNEVFKLHDTYGFPLDLTREIAAEQGLALDEAGFNQEMSQQKAMARRALREKGGSAWGQGVLPEGLDRSAATVFTGYETLTDEGVLKSILISDEEAETMFVRPGC